MENKIFESLKKMLPENEVKEVSSVISEMIENAKDEMEKEYNKNLEEAYAQLSGELASAEKTAYEGYQEAYEIINDLRTRLEVQKQEFDAQLEEGYEEAYQMLLAERNTKSQVEVDLYEEYDQKLAEMKAYIVEKVDQFLQYKGAEIYEQAKKDLVNDPRILEHKVALDKIVDITANYLSDEDFAAVSSAKLEEATKAIEEMKGQLRIMEARNIRLSTENTKLNEAVRQAQEVITESKKVVAETKKEAIVTEQKERTEKAKDVTGRGNKDEGTVISEYAAPQDSGMDQLLVLSGLKQAQ